MSYKSDFYSTGRLLYHFTAVFYKLILSNIKPSMPADGVQQQQKSTRQWINSNGNSAHCCTGLEGKAHAFLLHNQSLLMARQRSLRMQTLAVPASYNIWHQSSNFVISPRSNNFLCATARQCAFPNPPYSQVLHFGERRPLSVPANTQTVLRQRPREARAEREGSLSNCTHLQGPRVTC